MNKSELLENYTAEQLAERYLNLLDRYNKREECYKKIINTLPEELKQGTEFHLEIDRLQSEVEEYRKAFEDAKKERDYQIAEYQKKIEELQKQLDRSQTTITQIDGILEELFGVKHDVVEYGEFEQFLRDKVTEKVADFLPTEPIKVADMLIDNATAVYENYVENFAKAHSGQLVIGNPCKDVRRQTFSYLRQIADHLLIYCNHNESENE